MIFYFLGHVFYSILRFEFILSLYSIFKSLNFFMKKFIFSILITLILFLSTPSLAQLRIGVMGGPVLSSLVRDSNLSARAGMVGYIVGGVAKLNVGELGWFFQSGVTYSLEGDNDQNLNFIKIPLTIGFDASDDVNIHVAYNLAWQVGNHNNVQEFYNEFINILGIGFEIYVSKKFGIGSRLNYGLSNLVSEPAAAKNFDVKPFTLDLYLTYFLK